MRRTESETRIFWSHPVVLAVPVGRIYSMAQILFIVVEVSPEPLCPHPFTGGLSVRGGHTERIILHVESLRI